MIVWQVIVTGTVVLLLVEIRALWRENNAVKERVRLLEARSKWQ